MALVIPNLGELELLDKMIKDSLITDENYLLNIYTNAHTPNSLSTAGSFVNASFTGYTQTALTRANFDSAITNVDGKAESTYSITLAWTSSSSAQTLRGYYVKGEASNVVLWAESFALPRVINSGDIIKLTPRVTLSSEN